MKFEWHIQNSDVHAVQGIVAQQRGRAFVIGRISRNVDGRLVETSQSTIWQTLLMCLLTSQQRSGPNRPVSNLLNEKPFRLHLERCKNAENVRSFVNSTLKDFGGIRFIENVSNRAASNFEKLENGEWNELLAWLERLKKQRLQPPTQSHHRLERQAALYMNKFEGFGPKQSRNFWQALGLTRYEFVLDSRITGWLNKMKFPIPLSSAALGDEAYYVFLSDILRRLCIKAKALPCVFDPAVFASYDKQELNGYESIA